MSTPQTPVYAKSLPNNGCGPRRFNNLYIPDFIDLIKEVEVTTNDPQLVIIDNSTEQKYSFNIDYTPATILEATLNLIAKKSGVTQALPILKGDTIDEINLTWGYNNAIVSQELSSPLADPNLNIPDRSYDYVGQSITEDTSFTLNANDGKGLSGSIDNATKTLTFGNYFYYGHGPSLLGKSSSIQAFIDGLTKDIETSRVKNIFATGGEDQHFFFAFPVSFGLPSHIKKGIFAGGYIRLLNVAGVFQTSGNESDLNLNNGLISEPYYIYQSAIDNQNDATEPVEIS